MYAMLGFRFRKVVLIGVLTIFLSSCCGFGVKKKLKINIADYKYCTYFISHNGDTIIGFHSNRVPEFGVERKTSEDNKAFYVWLDSCEYLEVYGYDDMASSVTWLIKKK